MDYDRCINDPYLEVLESMDNKVGPCSLFFISLRAKTVEISQRNWPREVVDVPSSEVFKVRLHGALSNLIWVKVPLPLAVGLD